MWPVATREGSTAVDPPSPAGANGTFHAEAADDVGRGGGRLVGRVSVVQVDHVLRRLRSGFVLGGDPAQVQAAQEIHLHVLQEHPQVKGTPFTRTSRSPQQAMGISPRQHSASALQRLPLPGAGQQGEHRQGHPQCPVAHLGTESSSWTGSAGGHLVLVGMGRSPGRVGPHRPADHSAPSTLASSQAPAHRPGVSSTCPYLVLDAELQPLI